MYKQIRGFIMRRMLISAVILLSIASVVAESSDSPKQPESSVISKTEDDSGVSPIILDADGGITKVPEESEKPTEPKMNKKAEEQQTSIDSNDDMTALPDLSSEETTTPPQNNSSTPEKTEEHITTSVPEIPLTSTGLRLEVVSANDLFAKPNVAMAILEPGHWTEVPTAISDGWKGSVLISGEVLDAIASGNIESLSKILIKKKYSDATTSDDKSIGIAFIQALSGLVVLNDQSRTNFELIKLANITSYSEFLKAHGLERFDKGNSYYERPQMGFPVAYSKESGRVKVDEPALKEMFASRMEVAKKILGLANQIDEFNQERNKLIEKSALAKLEEVKDLESEIAEIEQKKKEKIQAHADEISQLLATKKTGEQKLEEAKQKLVAANDALSAANRAVQSARTRTARNTANSRKTSAVEAQSRAQREVDTYVAHVSQAEVRLKELGALSPEDELKIQSNKSRIDEIEKDETVKGAIAMEKAFDAKILGVLDEIKDCFDRLTVLDPSKITAIELKARKLSSVVRERVDTWNSLLKANKTLSEQIEEVTAKNRDAIAKIKEQLATTATELERAQQELSQAEVAFNNANNEYNKAPRGRRGDTARRNANNKKQAAQTAKNTAQTQINAYLVQIQEAEERLSGLEPKDLITQLESNRGKIKEFESNNELVSAKKILDQLEIERAQQQPAPDRS